MLAHRGATRTTPGISTRTRIGAVWRPRPLGTERRQYHPLWWPPRGGRGTDRGRATPCPLGPPGHACGEDGTQAAPLPRPPRCWNAPDARARPRGGTQPQARQGGNGTGLPPPPKQARQRTGPRQGTGRGTDSMERPYQRPAPEPREVHAPYRPGEGGRARTP